MTTMFRPLSALVLALALAATSVAGGAQARDKREEHPARKGREAWGEPVARHDLPAPAIRGVAPPPPRPDSDRRDLPPPYAGRPDYARPDYNRPDDNRPDYGRPDDGRPDSSRPDSSRPDYSRPDYPRAYRPRTDSLGADWRQQQYEARNGVRSGRLAPLGRVIDDIRRRSPGRQLDAGLEPGPGGHTVYRVRWATTDGHRLDYIVDAESGRILGVDGR